MFNVSYNDRIEEFDLAYGVIDPFIDIFKCNNEELIEKMKNYGYSSEFIDSVNNVGIDKGWFHDYIFFIYKLDTDIYIFGHFDDCKYLIFPLNPVEIHFRKIINSAIENCIKSKDTRQKFINTNHL